MTNIEVAKIETRVLGESLKFFASKSSEDSRSDFTPTAFRSSAKELKKSWKEKEDANPSPELRE
jgi:hypothetical protein